jgi:predicted transcriptional regulator
MTPPRRNLPSVKRKSKAKPTPKPARADIFLPMNQPYMSQIVSGIKNFEFRKYRISGAVKRIWFFVTAPESRISHVCEIGAARTRTADDEPLPLPGLGNKEFNERHPDWNGYDYAYEILSVRALKTPLALDDMKKRYGWKGAPRGLVYVVPDMIRDVPLDEQIKVGPKASSDEAGQ